MGLKIGPEVTDREPKNRKTSIAKEQLKKRNDLLFLRYILLK